LEINATPIAQIINFLILVSALTYFAYKPLLKMLSDRQMTIQNNLDSAEQEKLEAAQLKKEYLDKLNDARSQAQVIVEKANKMAEQTKEEMLIQARAEREKILQAGHAEIERERYKTENELRNKVVSLSVAAAAKIIDKNMDEQTHAKLVDDFINDLDSEKIGELPC
jgi:F-type H+-transporting ATPase subunit b